MIINGTNFNKINAISSKNNQRKAVNFEGKKDIADISQIAKERFGILKKLQDCGFDAKQAFDLYNTYTKTEEYDELINGTTDKFGTYPSHFIESINRNLTPEEAIVYQAFEMSDYYMQYGEFGSLPECANSGTMTSIERLMKAPSFLPLELAKTMNKGFDIVLAGMILKNQIDEETAKKVNEYYKLSEITYENKLNAAYCEENIEILTERMPYFEFLISDEKDEEGNLKSGLTRPLTPKEAVKISDLSLSFDVDSINFYIWAKDKKNTAFADIAIFDETREELLKEYRGEKVEKNNTYFLPKNHIKVSTIEDMVIKYDFICQSRGKKLDEKELEYLEDVKQLDSKKFFKRYDLKALDFDVMRHNFASRELRQKNIALLNTLSDTVLKKIGKFPLLSDVLVNENLEEIIAELNMYAQEYPEEFEKFASRAFLLDKLSATCMYQEMEEKLNEFKTIERLVKSGATGEEIKAALDKSGEILPFTKKD